MVQNIKPITKQLLIATLILASIIVLSLGIRQVRFSTYRADITEPAPSARPSVTEDQHQPKNHLYTNAEPDYYPDDSYTIEGEYDSQHADVSNWDEEMSTGDYSEENTDSIKYDNAVLKSESFKGDYAKAEVNKDLQKITLGEYEDLYLTKEGEYWYVSKQPNGSTTKMQVKINDDTGELIAVGGGYYAKQEPQRIPIGEREDIYLTDEGEAWYVSEQPDGDTLKMQVQID
jgi:hypothetical protein